MARAVIGGRTYAIAPFRLRELRHAAPHIDRIAESARSGAGQGAVEGLSRTAYDILCVLAIGVDGATPEALEAEASLDELAALRITFDEILEEAGLKRAGEPQPAASPEALADPPTTDPSPGPSTT